MASRRLPFYGKGYRNANSDAILIISVSIPMFSGPGKPILQLKFGFKYILCSFSFNTRLFSQNIFVFFTVFVLLRNKATILDACQFSSGLATLSKFCMHICLCFRYMCYEFQSYIYSTFLSMSIYVNHPHFLKYHSKIHCNGKLSPILFAITDKRLKIFEKNKLLNKP